MANKADHSPTSSAHMPPLQAQRQLNVYHLLTQVNRFYEAEESVLMC